MTQDIYAVREQSIRPSVVALFPGALGDLLLVLPVLRALRARHRRDHVTLVVNGWLVELAHLCAVSDAVASLDRADAAMLFRDGPLPPWLPPGARVYSWLGARDPELRRRLKVGSVAATLLRVERRLAGEHAASAYYLRALAERPSRDELARLAQVKVPVSPAAAVVVGQAKRPLLVLHTGAGSRRKRWAWEGFAAVANWWTGAGGAVVELRGPAEVELPPLPGALAAEGWRLPDVLALLADAAAYCGNDSGVSHLAGAAGAAGVVLFGPTLARSWRPLGRGLAVVQAAGLRLDELPVARVRRVLRPYLTLTR